jgi:hypothetical protein
MDINDATKFVAAFLADQKVPTPRDDLLKGCVRKLVHEDMKAYCTEAITMQPDYGISLCVKNWLFNETVFGKALWTLRGICRDNDDEYYQYLGRNSIVPDRQVDFI